LQARRPGLRPTSDPASSRRLRDAAEKDTLEGREELRRVKAEVLPTPVHPARGALVTREVQRALTCGRGAPYRYTTRTVPLLPTFALPCYCQCCAAPATRIRASSGRPHCRDDHLEMLVEQGHRALGGGALLEDEGGEGDGSRGVLCDAVRVRA